MTEEEKKEEIAPELDHNAVVQEVIDKVTNKDSVYYIYCPPMSQPSGGIAVLLRMAKILKDSERNVKVIFEPRINQRLSFEKSQKVGKNVEVFDNFSPTWLNFDISGIDFVPMGDKEIEFADGSKVACSQLTLKPEDFMFIPEGFPDLMKKTMYVACKRIAIAQSWFYILNAMGPGEKWQNFGIQDVISVSNAITEYLNAIMPGLKIKQFSQSIDRSIFKVPSKKSEKFPMVAYSCNRGPENRMKTHNVIKMFQQFYPHQRWVRFIELSGLSREEFAERLASCAFYLYTDDIAGFGTSPLEAMACGTHVIGWNAFGGKEYANKDNGFWTVNGDIFQTAEIMGVAIDKWLNGEMDTPAIQDGYEGTLSRYTIEHEQEQILKIIDEYGKQRIIELEELKKK